MKDLISFIVVKPSEQAPFNKLYNEMNAIWTEAAKIKKTHSIYTYRARRMFLESQCELHFHRFYRRLQDLITRLDYFEDLRNISPTFKDAYKPERAEPQ